MFERYLTKDITHAVTIGGPGGEAQYLLDEIGCRVFGVTLLSPGAPDFHPSLNRVGFSAHYGCDADGDLSKISNVATIISEINGEHRGGVDFFGGDACSDKEFPRGDAFDAWAAQNDIVIKGKVMLALSVLRPGGEAFFKVFGLTSEIMQQTIEVLMLSFDSVRVVKLNMSRSFSTELHVVCIGFAPNQLAYAHYVVGARPTFPQTSYAIQEYFDRIFSTNLAKLKRVLYRGPNSSTRMTHNVAPEIQKYYENLLCRRVEDHAVGAVGLLRRVVASVTEYFRPSDPAAEMIAQFNERHEPHDAIALPPPAMFEDEVQHAEDAVEAIAAAPAAADDLEEVVRDVGSEAPSVVPNVEVVPAPDAPIRDDQNPEAERNDDQNVIARVMRRAVQIFQPERPEDEPVILDREPDAANLPERVPEEVNVPLQSSPVVRPPVDGTAVAALPVPEVEMEGERDVVSVVYEEVPAVAHDIRIVSPRFVPMVHGRDAASPFDTHPCPVRDTRSLFDKIMRVPRAVYTEADTCRPTGITMRSVVTSRPAVYSIPAREEG